LKSNSDILELIKQQEKERDNKELRTSVGLGVTQDPDATAKRQALSKQLSIPVDVIERDEKGANEAAHMQDIFRKIKDSKKLQETFSDPDVAAIAHDDVEELAELDRITAGEWAEGVIGEASLRLYSSAAGIKEFWADYLGDEVLAERAQADYRISKEAAEMIHPDFKSDTAEGVYSGAVSTLSQAPGLLLGILGRSRSIPLAYIGVMTLGESYGKYKGRGATPREALLGGSLETALEIATEMGPMGTIIKKLGGQIGLRKFITELFAREVVGEQVATLGQELVDTMIANPDKSLRDYIHEIPRNAYQTLIATLTQTTIMGSTGAGASYLSRRRQYQAARTDDDYQQAEKALDDQAQLDAEVGAAQKTKLIGRGKVGQDALMNHLTNTLGAENEVHLEADDAKAFFQKHPDALDNLTDATKESAIESMQAEVGVSIPKAEYIAYVSNYHDELRPVLRNDIDGMTAAEAEQWAETAKEQVTQEAGVMLSEMDEAIEQLSPEALETPETIGFNLGPKMEDEKGEPIMMPEFETVVDGRIKKVKLTAQMAMDTVNEKTEALQKLQACING
jgi:hypothetical protein